VQSDQDTHSAQWLLDDLRDEWWDHDHLRLIAARLGLDRVRSVLDVGCGIGHWTFLLASVLDPDTQLTGVDWEPRWIRDATSRAEERGGSDRFRFLEGDATELDFEDASFDLVTCQTLLMHVADPRAAIRELLRVTKPGGLVLASEPNNLTASVMRSSTNLDAPIEDMVESVRFVLTCERGKAALGEGVDSIGNLVPGYLAQAGAVAIQTFISDKTHAVYPPYNSDRQQALCAFLAEGPGRTYWPREKSKRYFLAGGGTEDEFDRAWEREAADSRRVAAAVQAATFHTTGGFILYLTAGRRVSGSR
jgi:predicted O-methyltransferase YrrM